MELKLFPAKLPHASLQNHACRVLHRRSALLNCPLASLAMASSNFHWYAYLCEGTLTLSIKVCLFQPRSSMISMRWPISSFLDVAEMISSTHGRMAKPAFRKAAKTSCPAEPLQGQHPSTASRPPSVRDLSAKMMSGGGALPCAHRDGVLPLLVSSFLQRLNFNEKP